MRSALIVFAMASSGCILHYETQRNAPAHLASAIENPPKELRLRGVEKGEDTGMRGWLGHMFVYGGGNIDSKGSGGAAGFEIGAMPFELDKYAGGDAPFEAQTKIWFRPSIGWMFVDESNLRITNGRKFAGVGPLYMEAQFIPYQGRGGFGVLQIGAGPLVDLAYEDGGAQATICGGPHVLVMMICLRGAALVNRGPEFGIFIGANGLGSVAWAK